MVSASTLSGGPRRPMLEDESDATTSGRHRPPRPSTIGIQQSTMSFRRNRNRRRSSARFLQLNNRGGVINEEPEDCMDEQKEDSNSGNLQELYKKVIRMNAENKINASNSWSLNLIENIDTFLEEDEENDLSEEEQEEEKEEGVDVNKENGDMGNTSLVHKDRRVNFTKASCTLDASVKIYSYRVDDVHLTSYKVLANLHRNSNKDISANAQASNQDTNGHNDEDNSEQEGKGTEKSSGNAPTLEQNIGKLGIMLSVCFVPSFIL